MSEFAAGALAVDFLHIVKSIQEKRKNESTEGNVHEQRQKVQEELDLILNSQSGVDPTNLRRVLLRRGQPSVFDNSNSQQRAEAWKSLLGLVGASEDAAMLQSKIESCPAAVVDKIKHDAFRTFKGNEAFWSKVQEASLVRVLSAIGADCGYVQGMNVLLGPLALVLSNEADAYGCMHCLVSEHMPAYVLKNLDGVHRGVKLLDTALQLMDPALYAYILGKIPDLTIFALKFVLTLCANAQPLDEVLRLWDLLFALGIHTNIVVVCVHLMSLRAQILKQNSAFKIMKLIEEAPLDSAVLVEATLAVVPLLPQSLMQELLVHTREATP